MSFDISRHDKILQWNDPKMKISVVAGSFHFRTRRNDTRSSFHGMTGTRLKRPTLFGKGSPNGEKGGSNDLGFTVIPISHSCHSDRIPRSKVVLSHSGKKGTFRMTSERCRNEGRGGAEVGCFPLWEDSSWKRYPGWWISTPICNSNCNPQYHVGN